MHAVHPRESVGSSALSGGTAIAFLWNFTSSGILLEFKEGSAAPGFRGSVIQRWPAVCL